MAKKNLPKRKSQKKLSIRKETIRDLTTKNAGQDGVRGGVATVRGCY